MAMAHACYHCRYRADVRDVPAYCGSSCQHPAAWEALDARHAHRTGLDDRQHPIAGAPLNITAECEGVNKGCFMWPVAFDPRWLIHCDGFTRN